MLAMCLEVFTLLFEYHVFRLINALRNTNSLLLDFLSSYVILGILASQVLINVFLSGNPLLGELPSVLFLHASHPFLMFLLHLRLLLLLDTHVNHETLLFAGLADLASDAFLISIKLFQAGFHAHKL